MNLSGATDIRQGVSPVYRMYQGSTIVWQRDMPIPDTNVIYYTTEDGRVEIPSFSGTSIFGAEFINSIYSGNTGIMYFDAPITKIGRRAFFMSLINSIIIPSAVTSIGEDAFTNSNLEYIIIPDNVTSIEKYAFCSCYDLANVTLPSSITTIEEYTFCLCTSLVSVNIPSSVETIAAYAFNGCAFSSITIPSSVTSIGNGAFDENHHLVSIIIPDSVIELGSGVFFNCDNLTEATLGNSIQGIPSSLFNNCSNLSTINYTGTMAQWNALEKDLLWNYRIPATVVHCADGDVTI